MTKRKLPIGIQTFREIRGEGYYYVDKTAWARRLVEGGKHYFLSRPRRFGKSLFLDTLAELFAGNRASFEGLAIYDHWDWSVRHPVVRLDFGSGSFEDPDGLRDDVAAQLDAVERGAEVVRRYDTASARLRHVLQALHERTGRRAAVLVDEYDKPILDALETPAAARANRDYLHGLYSTIKSSDAHVRFTFLTGVSRFSKVSLFSGLNNLQDITLDPRYSAVCGYTDADLDSVFAPELAGLDREEIRDWYNGYSWLGDERVYNPFDILLLFDRRQFDAWWFETGTPSFLVEMLARRGVSPAALDNLLSGRDLLSSFEVDDVSTEALLFQTGYLTIRRPEPRGGTMYYRLGYPNREVRQSLNQSLLHHLTGRPADLAERRARLYDLLAAGDLSGLETLFRALFAGIPYEWHTRNDIARFEGYYASVFYSCFASLGLDVTVEDSSSHGRLDMAVRAGGRVYLFEFKMVEPPAAGAGPPPEPGGPPAGSRGPSGRAMAQLKAKGYADKYRHLGQPIHLVAVEFDRATRNLAAFEAAPA